jgi:hypothetical protein
MAVLDLDFSALTVFVVQTLLQGIARERANQLFPAAKRYSAL